MTSSGRAAEERSEERNLILLGSDGYYTIDAIVVVGLCCGLFRSLWPCVVRNR